MHAACRVAKISGIEAVAREKNSGGNKNLGVLLEGRAHPTNATLLILYYKAPSLISTHKRGAEFAALFLFQVFSSKTYVVSRTALR